MVFLFRRYLLPFSNAYSNSQLTSLSTSSLILGKPCSQFPLLFFLLFLTVVYQCLVLTPSRHVICILFYARVNHSSNDVNNSYTVVHVHQLVLKVYLIHKTIFCAIFSLNLKQMTKSINLDIGHSSLFTCT